MVGLLASVLLLQLTLVPVRPSACQTQGWSEEKLVLCCCWLLSVIHSERMVLTGRCGWGEGRRVEVERGLDRLWRRERLLWFRFWSFSREACRFKPVAYLQLLQQSRSHVVLSAHTAVETEQDVTCMLWIEQPTSREWGWTACWMVGSTIELACRYSE